MQDSEYQKKLLKKKLFIICLSDLKYSTKFSKINVNFLAKYVSHTPIRLHQFLTISQKN